MKYYIIMVDVPTDITEITSEEYSGIKHVSKSRALDELKKARNDCFVYRAYMYEVEKAGV